MVIAATMRVRGCLKILVVVGEVDLGSHIGRRWLTGARKCSKSYRGGEK